MLNLNSTTAVLRVTTGSAGTIACSYSYVDVDQTTLLPTAISGAAAAAISTATTTTVVDHPASGKTRNVTGLVVSNDHASVNNAVVVDQYDGTNTTRHWKGTLAFGERVVFDASGYWTYYGTDGVPKGTGVSLGQILGTVSADVVAAPDTATIRVYTSTIAGRQTLQYVLPDGSRHTLSDKISEKGYSGYIPNSSTTIGLNLGVGWLSGGTVSHPTPAAGQYTQMKRSRFANVVTTTNQTLGLRASTADKRYYRGNGAGLGGFDFHCRFGIALWPAATVRLFVGLTNNSSYNVASDTVNTTHTCGFWHDTTDAASVLSFLTCDGTTATKAGITLATALATGQFYDAYIWCKPNDSTIYYKLVELNTGTTLVDTSTQTTLPGSSQFLGQEMAMSNGTANTTVTTTAIDVMAQESHSEL